MEYLSPEVLLNIDQNEKGDIWALGILLYEMIAGVAPFVGVTKEQMLDNMKQTIPFSEVFDLCEIDLIKKILRVGKNKRPDISQILSHQYFSALSDDKSISASTVVSRENDDCLVTPAVKKVRKISV